MANTEALDRSWKGKGWSDGEAVTRVLQPDGTYAEGVAGLTYYWNGSAWVKTQQPTAVISGSQNVTTAGTRVQLATNTCVSVSIKAKAANTGTIYVGDATVASTNGYQLAAKESISFDIDNTNRVYIDSSVNGEGVTFLAVN